MAAKASQEYKDRLSAAVKYLAHLYSPDEEELSYDSLVVELHKRSRPGVAPLTRSTLNNWREQLNYSRRLDQDSLTRLGVALFPTKDNTAAMSTTEWMLDNIAPDEIGRWIREGGNIPNDDRGWGVSPLTASRQLDAIIEEVKRDLDHILGKLGILEDLSKKIKGQTAMCVQSLIERSIQESGEELSATSVKEFVSFLAPTKGESDEELYSWLDRVLRGELEPSIGEIGDLVVAIDSYRKKKGLSPLSKKEIDAVYPINSSDYKGDCVREMVTSSPQKRKHR